MITIPKDMPTLLPALDAAFYDEPISQALSIAPHWATTVWYEICASLLSILTDSEKFVCRSGHTRLWADGLTVRCPSPDAQIGKTTRPPARDRLDRRVKRRSEVFSQGLYRQ